MGPQGGLTNGENERKWERKTHRRQLRQVTTVLGWQMTDGEAKSEEILLCEKWREKVRDMAREKECERDRERCKREMSFEGKKKMRVSGGNNGFLKTRHENEFLKMAMEAKASTMIFQILRFHNSLGKLSWKLRLPWPVLEIHFRIVFLIYLPRPFFKNGHGSSVVESTFHNSDRKRGIKAFT